MFSRFSVFFKPRFFSTSSTLQNAVLVKQEGVVKTLTLNRPVQRNAFNTELHDVRGEMKVAMWQQLTAGIKEGDADPSTNIIAIGATGDLFSCGNDLAECKTSPSIEQYANLAATNAKHLVASLIDCKKPVVALVNGGAVGIGCTMLGLCDLVYSSSKAYFLTPFATLGIVAEGGSSFTFPRIMGFAKASSLLLANEKMGAEKAFIAGLVTEVIPHEKFDEETQKRVKALARFPIKALIASKELVRGNDRQALHKANEAECKGIEHFLQSEECKASIQSFFAARSKKA